MPEGNIQLGADLLGVRYVIFRANRRWGTQPAFSGTDWVLTNSELASTFVLRHVQNIPPARLQELAAPSLIHANGLCRAAFAAR
jgi:hypothetical protein